MSNYLQLIERAKLLTKQKMFDCDCHEIIVFVIGTSIEKNQQIHIKHNELLYAIYFDEEILVLIDVFNHSLPTFLPNEIKLSEILDKFFNLDDENKKILIDKITLYLQYLGWNWN